jgi:hypothetical protein
MACSKPSMMAVRRVRIRAESGAGDAIDPSIRHVSAKPSASFLQARQPTR